MYWKHKARCMYGMYHCLVFELLFLCSNPWIQSISQFKVWAAYRGSALLLGSSGKETATKPLVKPWLILRQGRSVFRWEAWWSYPSLTARLSFCFNSCLKQLGNFNHGSGSTAMTCRLKVSLDSWGFALTGLYLFGWKQKHLEAKWHKTGIHKKNK